MTIRKMWPTTIAAVMMIALLSSFASAEIGQGPDPVDYSLNSEKEIVSVNSIVTPAISLSHSVVPGQWNYYATYDFDQLEGNARVSAVRLVAHIDGTVVNVDTDNDDIPEYTFTLLNEGDMWEGDVPTGTHIWSTEELTVHQYDDYRYDYEQVILPALRYWDNDYYYAGILSLGLGTDYILITAAYDDTYVAVDLDNDGTADQTNTLSSGQVWLLSTPAITLAGESLPGWAVGYDPRAGAHIYTTLDAGFTVPGGEPIQVHAFASMDQLFGSAYNIIPTTSLGKEYIFPRVDCLSPIHWDQADKMVFVATQPNTEIDIDADHDGLTDDTINLANPGDWAYWPIGSIDDAWDHGAYVSANEVIVAFYSSPGGGRGWDGFMSQMVPKLSARSDYWNSNGTSTIFQTGTSPYIHLFAYEDNTTVYRDTDNDGTADYTYTLDFLDGGMEILATQPGEHFWVEDPARHPVTMYQRIFYPASDCMSPVSYQVNPAQADLRVVEYRWGPPAPGYSFAEWPIFEGWTEVRIQNRGDGDAFNVIAEVMSWPPNTSVPDSQVTVGTILAGGSTWSTDTFSTRVDMANPGDPCEEVFWRIEYDDGAGVHHVIENVPEFPPGEGPPPCP